MCREYYNGIFPGMSPRRVRKGDANSILYTHNDYRNIKNNIPYMEAGIDADSDG